MDRRRLLSPLPRTGAVAFASAAFLAVAVFLVATLHPEVARAQANAADMYSGLFRLASTSTFVDGCFDPCMCPVQFNQPLMGTVRLAPAPPEPGFAVYSVTDLNWLVKGLDYWVTGTGTYRFGGQPLMHRLTLDLKVADRVVEHYDSGLTLVGTPIDRDITISISKNNMVCHDTVFNVTMRPLLTQEIAPYGLRQSRYEEGCFGACDCAVRSWPFFGRFGLVRLDASTTPGALTAPGEFGVVDLRGVVPDATTASSSAGRPVTGGGLYRADATIGTQRLRLALLEAGAGPTRFDSGDVPWGGSVKAIDADVAADGFACTDRVYSLHARRKPRSDAATQAIRTDPYRTGVIPAP